MTFKAIAIAIVVLLPSFGFAWTDLSAERAEAQQQHEEFRK